MYPSILVGNALFKPFCKAVVVAAVAVFVPKALALTGQAGWIKVQNSGEAFDIYYEPLSIQEEGLQVKRMLTLINYKDNQGKDASLVAETLFNCIQGSKQDQYTLMFSGHWAYGEPVNSSSVESEWRPVLKNSVGMNVYKIACK